MTDQTTEPAPTVPGMSPDIAAQVNEFVTIDTNQVAEVRDFLLSYSKRLAGVSKRSLLLVYFVAFVNLSSIALFQWYFVVYKGYSWLWTPVPLLILAVPIGVLWVYYRILTAVAQLPSVIADTADDAIRSVAGYKDELVELNKGGLTLFKRWKSYVFFGKVLWKIGQLTDNTSEAIGRFGLLSLMINPLFWLILLLSVLVSFAFSAFLVLICALHFLVF